MNLQRPCLIGVVHLGALPGAPAAVPLRELIEGAIADALAYRDAGFTGVIIENFGDAPFFKDGVPSETVAAMARVATEVRKAVGAALPIGFNVLRNDPAAALALCAACEGEFIRVNVHSGVMVTDQGVIEGCAADTVRRRKALGLQDSVQILADVLVKHASPLGHPSLAEIARDTFHRGRADALIVTGSGTGEATPMEQLRVVREAVPEAPLFAGSGVAEATLAEILCIADGVIVGSSLKRQGRLDQPVDPARASRFVEAAHAQSAEREEESKSESIP